MILDNQYVTMAIDYNDTCVPDIHDFKGHIEMPGIEHWLNTAIAKARNELVIKDGGNRKTNESIR